LLQNLLLCGFDTDVADFDAAAVKVADFGTVRADVGHGDKKLHTSGKTHASTKRIVGTTPYMVRLSCAHAHFQHSHLTVFASTLLMCIRSPRSMRSADMSANGPIALRLGLC
jgi:hypothetical protein